MTLLTGFQTLLYRYIGQEDIVVGSPISGRNRPEIEGLIGFFFNNSFCSNISGDPRFRELLKRVREVCLGAYAHQDLPFQKLVEALGPKRDTIHRFLVQVAFAFQNVPRQPLKLPGLIAIPVRTGLGNAKVDLTLFMWKGEMFGGLVQLCCRSIQCCHHYPDDGDFQSLLNVVVADPTGVSLTCRHFLNSHVPNCSRRFIGRLKKGGIVKAMQVPTASKATSRRFP